MQKRRKFIAKFKGKFYKSLYVTRSKECIVLKIPGIPFHRTFTLRDKKFHYTLGEIRVENPVINDKSPFSHTIKNGILRIYPKEFGSDLAKGVQLGVNTIFKEECTHIKKDYEIIDLDAFNCHVPNVSVIAYLPEIPVDIPKLPFLLYSEEIKFPEVKILVHFIDAAKMAEWIKETNKLKEKKEQKIKELKAENRRLRSLRDRLLS